MHKNWTLRKSIFGADTSDLANPIICRESKIGDEKSLEGIFYPYIFLLAFAGHFLRLVNSRENAILRDIHGEMRWPKWLKPDREYIADEYIARDLLHDRATVEKTNIIGDN